MYRQLYKTSILGDPGRSGGIVRIDLAGLSDTDRQAFLAALLELDPPLTYRPTSPRQGYDLPTFDYLDGTSWRSQAACKGLPNELFFPEQGDSQRRTRAAKKVCWVCPVREQCLDYALETGSRWGIWGGMTEKERRNARRRRRRA